MNEAIKKDYVKPEINVWPGIGIECMTNRPKPTMILEEARKALKESLGGKSLYDYVRQERDRWD